jgi:hypothetical protein
LDPKQAIIQRWKSQFDTQNEGGKMDFENVSEELREKARKCKTPEEILALANEEGYELTDEEAQGIVGGSFWSACRDYF